jgi:hypothetical protein
MYDVNDYADNAGNATNAKACWSLAQFSYCYYTHLGEQRKQGLGIDSDRKWVITVCYRTCFLCLHTSDRNIVSSWKHEPRPVENSIPSKHHLTYSYSKK